MNCTLYTHFHGRCRRGKLWNTEGRFLLELLGEAFHTVGVLAKVLYAVLWSMEDVLDRDDDMVEGFGYEDDVSRYISEV